MCGPLSRGVLEGIGLNPINRVGGGFSPLNLNFPPPQDFYITVTGSINILFILLLYIVNKKSFN